MERQGNGSESRLIGFWLVIGGLIACVVAVVAVGVGFEFWDAAIVHGPEVVVAAPDAGEWSSPAGRTTVQISHIDSAGLRLGWNLASAFILIGIGAFLIGLGRVLLRSDASGLFSEANNRRMGMWSAAAFVLIIVGGFTRFAIEGRVIAASGLESVDAEAVGFNLWVFEVPFLLLVLGSQVVALLWRRAVVIESDLEEVV